MHYKIIRITMESTKWTVIRMPASLKTGNCRWILRMSWDRSNETNICLIFVDLNSGQVTLALVVNIRLDFEWVNREPGGSVLCVKYLCIKVAWVRFIRQSGTLPRSYPKGCIYPYPLSSRLTLFWLIVNYPKSDLQGNLKITYRITFIVRHIDGVGSWRGGGGQ